MTDLYARANPDNRNGGVYNYTLFERGYPYSFGSVYPVDGGFKPSCLSREDRNWHPSNDHPVFATLPEALSYVRGLYEKMLADYHAQCAEIMDVLNKGLSKVEKYKNDFSDEATFKVKIGRDHGKVRFTMLLTPEQTITALDYLYSRDGSTVSICGAILDRQYLNEYRTAYADWCIPVRSNDYHLLDWRSREGVGRH